MTTAASLPAATRRKSVAGRLGHPRTYVGLAALSLLVLVPLGINDDFIFHVFITICLYGALATAWNIVGGFAGQLSLGHAIFYGIGAYTSTLLLASFGLTPWIGMFAGAAIAAMVGAAIAYPCFRLRGPFFVLATIAFLEVIRLLSLHFRGLTGGAVGLMPPLRIGWEWMIFREREPSLFIAFGFLCLCLLVAWWIRNSRFGFYLVAIRERDDAAQAAGINTVAFKLYAIMVSAALTSMVGSFHAMYLGFVEPESMFSLTFSVQIAMFALIGGIGTVFGPLFGTLLVVPVTELARGWLGAQAIGLHGFVYGTVLVLIVLFMPGGLVSKFDKPIGRLLERLPGGRSPAEATVEGRAPLLEPEVVAERSAPGQVILRVDSLYKRFGGLVVTENVGFELKQGQVLGIIGPNGAGKTTLFNQISGFIRPDAGSVAVLGTDGAWHSPRAPHEYARLGIGRTFQVVQPFAAMTVLENIMVGAFRRHPNAAEAREAALEVAERMGLWAMRHTEARNLTIGGQKRLEMARVMALEPRILLLDEVMAGLNAADVKKAVELVRDIRDSGVAVIAIEHVMQAIMSISDEVIVINAGRVIARGEPATVVRDPQVIEAYLGQDYVHAAS